MVLTFEGITFEVVTKYYRDRTFINGRWEEMGIVSKEFLKIGDGNYTSFICDGYANHEDFRFERWTHPLLYNSSEELIAAEEEAERTSKEVENKKKNKEREKLLAKVKADPELIKLVKEMG